MVLDSIDQVNWAAVGVSLVVASVIGSVWFAPPVMGNYWARQVSRYSSIPQNEISDEATRPASLSTWFVGMAINVLVLALVIAAVGADNLGEGVVLAIVLWLGFGATFSSWPPIFARMPWQWWMVNNGGFLLIQIAAGAILGTWQA